MATSSSLMSDFLADISNTHVVIIVGHDERRFSVPQSLLRRKSKWFENALKSDRFQEGITKEIALPEDDPGAVESFIFFIYHDALLFKAGILEVEQRIFDLKLCLNVWSFADKYLLPELQNAAMHRACFVLNDDLHNGEISTAMLTDCFKLTTTESPLRGLIGDYCVRLFDKHDKDDFQIEALEQCPGLMATLHRSWALRRKLDYSDFPRYIKPVVFADTLFMKEDGSQRPGGVAGVGRMEGILDHLPGLRLRLRFSSPDLHHVPSSAMSVYHASMETSLLILLAVGGQAMRRKDIEQVLGRG